MSDDIKELVKRLRAPEMFLNRDRQEAADAIEVLRAERDRLKAALAEQVAQYPDYSDICRKELEVTHEQVGRACKMCSGAIPLACSCNSCMSIYKAKKFCSRACTVKAGQQRAKIRRKVLNNCKPCTRNYSYNRDWPKGCAHCEGAVGTEPGWIGGRNG